MFFAKDATKTQIHMQKIQNDHILSFFNIHFFTFMFTFCFETILHYKFFVTF